MIAILNISGNTAFLGGIAILGAIVAATTAQLRLRTQLKHDSSMREREASRNSLDGVAAEISESSSAMVHAGEAFRELFRVRSAIARFGSPQPLDEAEEEASESLESLRERRAPLMGAAFRLHLRFEDSSPMVIRSSQWRMKFDELIDAYESALNSGDMEMKESFDRAFSTSEELGRMLFAFLEVARDWSSNESI